MSDGSRVRSSFLFLALEGTPLLVNSVPIGSILAVTEQARTQLITVDPLDGRVHAILAAAANLEICLAKLPLDHRDALLIEFRDLFENLTENEELALKVVMTKLRRLVASEP